MEPRRSLLAWLWRDYLSSHWKKILAASVLMVLEGSMLGAVSLLIKPMFDEVFIAANPTALRYVALGIFAVFLVRAFAGFGQRVLMAMVGQRVVAALQVNLLGHMLTLDSAFFRDHPPGNLIERVRGDTQAAATIWPSVFGAALRESVSLISLLVVAFLIDWRWTLLAVIGVPLFAFPAYLIQNFVRRTARQVRISAATLAIRLDEIFHGETTIRLNGTAARESSRFGEQLAKLVRRQTRAEAGLAALPAMTDVIAALGFLAVMFWGGREIVSGTKSVGEFMSFFTAMTLIFEPLRRLGNVGGAWASASASLARLREIFDEKPVILPPPQATLVPEGAPDVIFDAVDFAYEDTQILHQVSFRAKAGETTALVGPSGAGKSTIFHLIARLADPTAGSVRLNGIDIRDFDPAELRAAMSMVRQDTGLFDDTLADNITLGRVVSAEALADALRAAHVDEFLPRLDEGLDSQVGVRGSALSGGQRQRVAIARALLRDRPLLLLDEATSALDAASERHIQEALGELRKGRTVLVIAHRLSTVRDADKIVVFDHGRVVEQGSHDELLAQGGSYARLFHSQFTRD